MIFDHTRFGGLYYYDLIKSFFGPSIRVPNFVTKEAANLRKNVFHIVTYQMITFRWEWSRFCLNMALTKRPQLKTCTTRLTYSAMTGPKPRIFWNYHNLKENIAAALEDLLTMNLLPHPRQHLTIWMNLRITPPSLQVQKDFQCTGKALTKQEEFSVLPSKNKVADENTPGQIWQFKKN